VPKSLNTEPILGKRQRSQSPPKYRKIRPREILGLQPPDNRIFNNAVRLFYSEHSKAPRVRLLSACDNVEKLFAQALAVEVFEQDAGKLNALATRIPGLQKPLHIIESDEGDFHRLIELIKILQCCSDKAGEISGSCTVEIRGRT
jgi:hypothetical protein